MFKISNLLVALTVLVASSEFRFPVNGEYKPGSFNNRYFLANNKNHLGEDIKLDEGTRIFAIGKGKVVKYEKANGYGELVCVIEHDLGKEYPFRNGKGEIVFTRHILSIYGHLRKSRDRGGKKLSWKVGDLVAKGDLIGYVNDNSHNGHGAEHLHMGIRLSSAKIAMKRDVAIARGYDKGSGHYVDFSAASDVIERLIEYSRQEEWEKLREIDVKRIKHIAWYPDNVACVDASRWFRFERKFFILAESNPFAWVYKEEVDSNSICYDDLFIKYPELYEDYNALENALFGTNEECVAD